MFSNNLRNNLLNNKIGKITIYNDIMNAQNLKIILLTATPIINDPFELSFLFNILMGKKKNNFIIIEEFY